MPTHEHDDDLQRAYAAFLTAADTSVERKAPEPAATAYQDFAAAVRGLDPNNNTIDQRLADLMETIRSGMWSEAASQLAALRQRLWSL